MVADRLSELMHERGIDQSGLARLVGCSPAAINQILTGRTNRSRLLPDIAQEFGVSLRYLQGKSNDPAGGEVDLTAEEFALIDLWRALDFADRSTVRQLMQSLARRASETVHSPKPEYRPG